MNIITIITLWFLYNKDIIPQALAIWGTVIGSLGFILECVSVGIKIGNVSKE